MTSPGGALKMGAEARHVQPMESSEPRLTKRGDEARDKASTDDASYSMGLAQESQQLQPESQQFQTQSQQFQTQAPMDDFFDAAESFTGNAGAPPPDVRALESNLFPLNPMEASSRSIPASGDAERMEPGAFHSAVACPTLDASSREPTLGESVAVHLMGRARLVEAEEAKAPEQDPDAFFLAMYSPGFSAAAAQVPRNGEERQQQRDPTREVPAAPGHCPLGVFPSTGWAAAAEELQDLPCDDADASVHDSKSLAPLEEEDATATAATASNDMYKWVKSIWSSDDDEEQEELPPPSTRHGQDQPCTLSMQQTLLVLGLSAHPLPAEPSLLATSITSPAREALTVCPAPESPPLVQEKRTSPKDASAGEESEFRCPAPRAPRKRASLSTLETGNEQAPGSACGATDGSTAGAPAGATQAQAHAAPEPVQPAAAAAAAQAGNHLAGEGAPPTAPSSRVPMVAEPQPFVDRRRKLQPPFLRSPTPAAAKRPEGPRAEEESSQSPVPGGAFESVPSGPGLAGEQMKSHLNRAQQQADAGGSPPGEAASPALPETGGAGGVSRQSPDSVPAQESTPQQRLPGFRASVSGEGSRGHSATPGGEQGTGVGLGTLASAVNGKASGTPKSSAMSPLPVTACLLSGPSKGAEGVTPPGSAGRRDSGKGPQAVAVAHSASAQRLTALSSLMTLASPTSGANGETSMGPGKSPRTVAAALPASTPERPEGTGCVGGSAAPSPAAKTPEVSWANTRMSTSPAEAAQKPSPLTLRPPSPVAELRAKLLVVHAALAPRPSLLSASTKGQASRKSGKGEAAVGAGGSAEEAATASRNTEAPQAYSTPTVTTCNNHTGTGVSAQQDAERPQAAAREVRAPSCQSNEAPAPDLSTEAAPAAKAPPVDAASAPDTLSGDGSPAPQALSADVPLRTKPSTAEAAPVARQPTASAKKVPKGAASSKRGATAGFAATPTTEKGGTGGMNLGPDSTHDARLHGGSDGSGQAGAKGAGSQAGAPLSGGKQLGPGKGKQGAQGTEPPGGRIHWDPLLGMPLVSRERKRPTVEGTRAWPVKRDAARGPEMSARECPAVGPSVVGQSTAERSSPRPAVLGKPKKITARPAPAGGESLPSVSKFLTPQGKGKRPREHTPSPASESVSKRKTDNSSALAALRSRLPPGRRDLPEERLDLFDIFMYGRSATST